MLNGGPRRRNWRPGLFVLAVLASVVWFYGRLAALYAPSPQPPTVTRSLPVGFPEGHLEVPAVNGWQRLASQHGLLLVHGSRRVVGQTEVSLCDQRASTSPNATLLPLHIGWDWDQARAAALANLDAQPPRLAHDGLKNLLLDDGTKGVDLPAFTITTQPLGAPIAAYADAEPLLATLQERRPALLVADTATSSVGPTLTFRRDLWVLWNANNASDAAGVWNRAVRVRRLAQRRCALGRLQISVYASEATSDQTPRAVLWYAATGSAAGTVREFRLQPGQHTQSQTPPHREDAALFQHALQAGLLRPEADGRIAVAPADLALQQRYARHHPELLAPTDGGPDWLAGAWDETASALHRVLRFGASGRYVRQQVETFNSRQWLAAVRWRSPSTLHGEWSAEWNGAPLELTPAMPSLAGRLFSDIPRGWATWQRVAHWPNLAGQPPVHFRLTLDRPARRGESLELLVAGAKPTIEGAQVLEQKPRCLHQKPCRERDAAAWWLRLQWRTGVSGLQVTFQPQSAQQFPDLYRYDFAHIQRIGSQLRWRDAPPVTRSATRTRPAEVTLRDRTGQLLLADGQPTAAAWQLGLAALVGLNPAQRESVAGTLARLGRWGINPVDARLTLDPFLQTAALRALGTSRQARSRRMRIASLVVLDADRGEVLAAASNLAPPADAAWDDIRDFVLAQPQRSPLRLPGWQHDGGRWNAAGSTFKLVDALLLEHETRHRPELALPLGGASAEDWKALALAQTYDFAAEAACYPAHAQGCATWARRPSVVYERPGRAVHNFRSAGGTESLLERMQRQNDERYGLAQALRDSLNTWFAWLVETTDATLLDDATAPGLASARALTPNALHPARPLLAMATTLGFDTAWDLDGGLLPPGLITTGDALRTTPSALDPIRTRAQVRLAALGFRMQVTPLHMARIAASIATGRQTSPRLLAELNGQAAATPAGLPLDVATDRIRRGMRLVVESGTARAAFADPRLGPLRGHLYAKTGTADLDATGTEQNAWLVGWLEPGALPREPRRLAFACMMTQVQGTGGEECGPVVAAWLLALAAAPERTP